MVETLSFPPLARRLKYTIALNSFREGCLSIEERVRSLLDSCSLILSNDKLARILQKMLAIGNIMNEGTHKGQASGFTLDSLMKMVNTKGKRLEMCSLLLIIYPLDFKILKSFPLP